MPKNLTTLFKNEAVAEEQSQLLHLMTLEVPNVPDFTFCDSNDDATYNSVVYSKFPCKFNGVEVTSTGEINKANIQVSNVDRTISSMLENYNGLRGCTLRVKTVFAKFLDTVNSGWKFKNSTCGWGASGATLTTDGDGVLLTSTSNDPLFYTTNVSFAGADYTKVRVLIKRTAGSNWAGTLYYHTAGHGASESYKKVLPEPTYFSDFIELTFDMSQLTDGGNDWVTSTITALRFDFGTTNQDAFKIAYVIVEDNNGNILETLNPDASTTSFSEELYVIDSYTATETAVQFNLEPMVDFSVRLPRRRYTNLCGFRYKDQSTCGYTNNSAVSVTNQYFLVIPTTIDDSLVGESIVVGNTPVPPITTQSITVSSVEVIDDNNTRLNFSTPLNFSLGNLVVVILPKCKKDFTDCIAHENTTRYGGFIGVPSNGVRRIFF